LFHILHSIQIEIDGSYRSISIGTKKSIEFNLNLADDIVTYHEFASCFCYDCCDNNRRNGICRCTKCYQPEKKSFYKYRIHELIYGEKLIFNDENGNTVTNYKIRNNSPAFWLKHWGYAYSPFRVAQSILRKLNIYLVDYTAYGDILNAVVFFYLPRNFKSVDFWHKHHLIPGVCKEDFDYMFYGKIRYEDLEDKVQSLYRFCSGLMHPN